MKTFLFYDIETSGLNPAFDQVLTFAYIRTDLELSEISRQTITINLRDDIVPSPKAFLTHGLTYSELETGINEYQAAQKIHKILNTPGTISIGYNSLRFDDEFLRFFFYRNLLDPYSHQYSNHCSRMDILPITIVYKLFYPESLQWPKVDGKSSLKLELISKENSFEISGRAHEAMSDVEAVIALAKIMILKNDIWLYGLDFFNKIKDEIRINKIKNDFQVNGTDFKICLMLSTSFGSENNYIAPVMNIGQSLSYKNQSLWIRLDLEDFFCISFEVDLKETFVIRKRPADALIVLPALERFWNIMPLSVQKLANKNLEKINFHKQKFFEFIQYHQEYKHPFIPDLDSDAALYQDGFFSYQEKKENNLFHKLINNIKSDFQASDILNQIQSPRIKKIAQRIIYRNLKNKKWQTREIESSLGMDKLRSPLAQDHIVGYKNDIKFNQTQGLQELKEVHSEILNSDEGAQKKMFSWLTKYIENL